MGIAQAHSVQCIQLFAHYLHTCTHSLHLEEMVGSVFPKIGTMNGKISFWIIFVAYRSARIERTKQTIVTNVFGSSWVASHPSESEHK